MELGSTWSGWSPKMKASFDIETHAWKPPWFRDGVEGVYIEPFPSNLWLKNGLSIPLTEADKYIFTRDEATQVEDEQKQMDLAKDPKKSGEISESQEEKDKKLEEASHMRIPEV